MIKGYFQNDVFVSFEEYLEHFVIFDPKVIAFGRPREHCIALLAIQIRSQIIIVVAVIRVGKIGIRFLVDIALINYL